mmetsp:Transcript_5501/g.11989  ORF Transcript_5501/g.11989 Transcript_5501/m.11989 type:complete len:398 (-) Transcript_5501:86-1279(-)
MPPDGRDWSAQRLAEVMDLVGTYADDDWELLNTGLPSVQGYCKQISHSAVALQIRYVLPLTVSQAITLLRPESIESLLSPGSGDVFSDAALVKVLQPGDVIAFVRLRSWLESWMRLLDVRAFCRASRVLMFRDTPRPGMASLAGVEIGSNDGSQELHLCGGWGMLIGPGTMESQTMHAEIFVAPIASKSIVAPLMQKYGTSALPRAFGHTEHDYEDLHRRFGYRILATRKCCRGPPLFPVPIPGILPGSWPPGSGAFPPWISDIEWVPLEEPSQFKLPAFLRAVLAVCGMDPSVVYDFYDGRELIFYQASIRECAWQDLAPLIRAMVKNQQTAYRRLKGGTGAPYIQEENAVPRFRDLPHMAANMDFDDPICRVLVESCFEDQEPHFQVKNTFVHFG